MKNIWTELPFFVPGKFSIRIVPNQTPDEVEAKVKSYLEKRWKERGSVNKMKVSMGHGGRPWVSDVNHANYQVYWQISRKEFDNFIHFLDAEFQAGIKATKTVYGVAPDLTREGKPASSNWTMYTRPIFPFNLLFQAAPSRWPCPCRRRRARTSSSSPWAAQTTARIRRTKRLRRGTTSRAQSCRFGSFDTI